MVIKGVGGVAVPQGGTAGAGRSTPGFSVRGTAGSAAGPAAVSATAGIDGLLLLQEAEDAPARDRQARKHGRAMLDALAKLQLALLVDGCEGDGLATLGALVEHCPEAADPALRDAIAAVTLRARVELARRGV